MCISLPSSKQESLLNLVFEMSNKETCSIRQFAQFLGSLVACCPAILYGWLHTKLFEREVFSPKACWRQFFCFYADSAEIGGIPVVGLSPSISFYAPLPTTLRLGDLY